MPPELDHAQLTRIAQRALAAPGATLLDHAIQPLDYDAYLPGRLVTRVAGHALVEGRSVPWSAILKWTDPLATSPTAPTEKAHREALAYQSGLLEAGGWLRAPRAYEIDASEDGHVALWLEDLGDDGVAPWSLETFGAAAFALGQFNGAFCDWHGPTESWFVPDWASRQSEPLDASRALADIRQRASDPRVRQALGDDIGQRLSRMLHDQAWFIACLGELPQTLCHHDAARSNLIARRREDGAEIAAIDWESLGPGPAGADIAALVSGSLRKGDFPATRAAELDAAVMSAYVDGLHDAGAQVDRRVVRLGYTMSLALRCWFVRDTIENLTDRNARPLFGRARDVPPADVLDAFVLISRFLLDRADEARVLETQFRAGVLTR